MSNSLRPHESQHTRLPCPSPTPGVHSDSCPSSPWKWPSTIEICQICLVNLIQSCHLRALASKAGKFISLIWPPLCLLIPPERSSPDLQRGCQHSPPDGQLVLWELFYCLSQPWWWPFQTLCCHPFNSSWAWEPWERLRFRSTYTAK